MPDDDRSQVYDRTLLQAVGEAGFKDTHLADTRPETWAPILGEVPLFSGLSPSDHVRIAQTSKVAHVSAGQYLCRRGLSAEAFYIVLTGRAMVDRGHGEQIELRRGDFFGELGLIDGAPRSADVVAATDLWVARLPKDRFAALIDDEPVVARKIMEALVGRIRRLEATTSE